MKKFLFGRRMWLMLIATLLVFGGVVGMQWYGRIKMNEFMDNMPVPEVTVTSGEARLVRWRDAVNSVGTLAAIQGAELATEVPGTIERILFDNGTRVAAGDIILQLHSQLDRAELAELEAARELAVLELRRARKLVAQRNISDAELDQRASQLEQARARVEAQKARIEQKTLRAPYAGRLGIRRFNVGDYIQTGQPFIELQSLERLYVNFSLPEQHSEEVEVGMAVTAIVEAIRNESFSGTINAIAPLVDPDTRNFALQATLENPDGVLRPGMFARLRLPIGMEIDRVVVPRTAISYRPYGNSVYVLQGTEDELTVSQRFVTLGAVRGDLVAIEEGLEPGERVATSGLLKLDSGVPVNIDNSVQPDASLAPRPDNG